MWLELIFHVAVTNAPTLKGPKFDLHKYFGKRMLFYNICIGIKVGPT